MVVWISLGRFRCPRRVARTRQTNVGAHEEHPARPKHPLKLAQGCSIRSVPRKMLDYIGTDDDVEAPVREGQMGHRRLRQTPAGAAPAVLQRITGITNP